MVSLFHELDCKELSVLMVAESMCQAYFLHQKSDLKEHMKSVHEGKKPFLCIERAYVTFKWVFCVKLSQQIVHSNVFSFLHELDCKESSVLMVAESMCQAYFLHELNPCVLALHRNLT